MDQEGRRPTPERRAQRHETRTSQTYVHFLKNLGAIGGMSREEAERAAVSVLCAIEQRLYGDEAEHLNAQLPVKLKELLARCPRHGGAPPRKFGRDELLQLVADDLSTTPEDAEFIVRAVLQAVRDQVTEGEVDDVISQLPQDLAELWRRPV
jgi:uncharacterized protein (DUF2267 family)